MSDFVMEMMLLVVGLQTEKFTLNKRSEAGYYQSKSVLEAGSTTHYLIFWCELLNSLTLISLSAKGVQITLSSHCNIFQGGYTKSWFRISGTCCSKFLLLDVFSI